MPRANEIDGERCRRSLGHFIRRAWHVPEPGTDLLWNWHIDAIADHLEAVYRGEIKRLVINIPPRYLKSLCVGVFFPAWVWLKDPSFRFLTASYKATLAERDAVKCRRIMTSPWYTGINIATEDWIRDWRARGKALPDGVRPGGPLWDFTTDQNVKSYYINTFAGHRYAVGADGGSTGEGGDLVMVDDPHNPKQAESDNVREARLNWWDEEMSSRLNNKKTGRRIIVMQRLHSKDLTGHVLAKDAGYEHLCIRTEFEHADLKRRTVLGPMTIWDPRTEEGEALHPDREDIEELAQSKKEYSPRAWAAQQQQRPTPREGEIFILDWWRRYKRPPKTFDRVIQTWDLTFGSKARKQSKKASRVAGLVIGVKGARKYVLHATFGRWTFTQSLTMFEEVTDSYPAAIAKLVENKANGAALEDTLCEEVDGILLIEPVGDKEARAEAIAPLVAAGNVYIPHDDVADRYPWVREFLAEVQHFPNHDTDDIVDAFSQGMHWLKFGKTVRAVKRARAMVQM